MKIKIALLAVMVLLAGCSEDHSSAAELSSRSISEESKVFIEVGDLPEIKARGELRIIFHERDYLPRGDSLIQQEIHDLESFAESKGLRATLIPVSSFGELIPTLIAGKGDVIAGNMTATGDRQQRIAFTHSIEQSNELLVSAKGKVAKELAVQPSTSFWSSAEQLVKNKGYTLVALDDKYSADEVLELINDGTINLSIVDSNAFEQAKSYLNNIRVIQTLSKGSPIAWGVRNNSPLLLSAINKWLSSHQLNTSLSSIQRDDLDTIKKRGVLRVSLLNDLSSYFLLRGELRGYEYEFLHKFADAHDLRISVVVANNHKELLTQVIDGKADIAAGFLYPTEQRKSMGLSFSRKYHAGYEVLAGGKDESVGSLLDLSGKTLHLRKSSSYWHTAEQLIKEGADIKLIAVAESMNTNDILVAVADGRWDYTIADSHIVDMVQTWRDDLFNLYALGNKKEHGWAVRKQDLKLLDAINSFHKKKYRGLFSNIIFKRYFKNSKRIKGHIENKVEAGKDLSPYDDLVIPLAKTASLDWRLVTAQMYQESRFNPDAVSWVGAKGLMQVMPRTGKEFGFIDLHHPEVGLKAGVRYLQWVTERFESTLPPSEKIWFTLAAYNAGAGHVRDARRLAAQQGLNPNVWFDNVEKAMLMLSQRQYHRYARYGYVRGKEPVNYVREIRERYLTYTAIDAVHQKSVAQEL